MGFLDGGLSGGVDSRVSAHTPGTSVLVMDTACMRLEALLIPESPFQKRANEIREAASNTPGQ